MSSVLREFNVVSSAISRIVYDVPAERLYVTFQTGRTYRYEGVSLDTHRAFIDASSKGVYFNQQIRERYPFSEVTRRTASLEL